MPGIFDLIVPRKDLPDSRVSDLEKDGMESIVDASPDFSSLPLSLDGVLPIFLAPR